VPKGDEFQFQRSAATKAKKRGGKRRQKEPLSC
jgi:hypothetical protein